MNRNAFITAAAAFTMTTTFSTAALADMRITEWMYSGSGGEFIEFTNVGNTAIDMTGWVYDDDSRITTAFGGAFDLSGFGTVQPGESIVITEDAVATFRADWGLSASVKVLGGYTNNIGRNDEINLYDNGENLIDRLTYGDEDFPGSFRTREISASIPFTALGINDVFAAEPSFLGDSYGSHLSANGDLGNPGSYAAVPAPGALAAFAVASLLTRRRRRA